MILVFGGTGFLGRNLVPELVRHHRTVQVVSRSPDTAFLARHAPRAHPVTLEMFRADPASVLYGCSTIVYLASASTPGSNLEEPWREASATVEPLLRTMTAVAEHSDAHVIYMSSGGTVYGSTDLNPIPETAPLNPISPYGLGKQMSETALGFLARDRGLRATILRAANPIGRWQSNPSQGVVGALCRAAAHGTAFPMLGEGDSVRDYFDVMDLCRAIIEVIDRPDLGAGRTWNVGSGRGRTLAEIHALVESVVGREIPVQRRPARSSDVRKVVLDISRISADLGWRPTSDLVRPVADVWDQVRTTG
jgi:UDP-glucose 4-epimerase